MSIKLTQDKNIILWMLEIVYQMNKNMDFMSLHHSIQLRQPFPIHLEDIKSLVFLQNMAHFFSNISGAPGHCNMNHDISFMFLFLSIL